MEVYYIEAGIFEEMLARTESLSAQADRLDNQDVCLRLDISPRTLQTLRDTGRLAFTQIQRKIYYRPEDVEKLMAYVAMKRKEKAVREKRKNE